MKYIFSFIKKIIPKEIVRPLGRWKIESCNVQINKKIDLSNEDHCGPCGEYILDKNKKNVKSIYKKNITV